MPVYNVAEYLEESLNSILNQSFIDEIEVILVDDESNDDSRYIVERYALDYENFYAYHKKNCGAGVARNYGLQFAKGEYVHFMDPDDYLNVHAYETLYNLAIENDCEIVIGNAVKYDRYKIWDENLFKKSFKGFKHDLKINNLNERLSILWDTVLWNKLFKTDFLRSNNISFPNENIIYEDIPFTLKSYVLANSIYITQDIMYFWRLRKKSTSSTQQYENIKTFYDRIRILDLTDELMNELDVDEEIRNFEYKKWLNHDLKLFLKRLTNFSENYYGDILFNIHRILKKIPSEFIDELNSYKKVMYKMVENDDLNSLKRFSYLENTLMKHPVVPDSLDEKYHEYIDFSKDGMNEEFIIKKLDIDHDNKNIKISFKENINYILSSYPHQIHAKLFGKETEHDLNVIDGNIVLPLNLLTNFEQRGYIKASYVSEKFKKETFLTSDKRQVVRFEDFDVEFGISFNKILTINVRKTNDNVININEITFKDDEFEFKGVSNHTIKNIVLENVLTFNQIKYEINYDGNFFNFKIPYCDLCNHPIRKWEIKTDSLFNVIKLPKKYYFYKKTNKIIFLNARNKILIEDDIYNDYEELYESNEVLNEVKQENIALKNKNNELNDQNYNLIEKNIKLKNKLDEYKSRKIVRFTDEIKKMKG